MTQENELTENIINDAKTLKEIIKILKAEINALREVIKELETDYNTLSETKIGENDG